MVKKNENIKKQQLQTSFTTIGEEIGMSTSPSVGIFKVVLRFWLRPEVPIGPENWSF